MGHGLRLMVLEFSLSICGWGLVYMLGFELISTIMGAPHNDLKNGFAKS